MPNNSKYWTASLLKRRGWTNEQMRALLPKLKKGFDEQWTQLMASERFDVEADMAVVSQLLHTEGLTWETKADESA